MNRLLSHSVARVLRARPFPAARRGAQACMRPAAIQACRYTSSTPHSPTEFEKHLAALRPGMDEQSLAAAIAATIETITEPVQWQQLLSLLPQYAKGHDWERLNAKVAENLPEEDVKSFKAGLVTLVGGKPKIQGDDVERLLESLSPSEMFDLENLWEDVDGSKPPKVALEPIIEFFEDHGMDIRIPSRQEQQALETKEPKEAFVDVEKHINEKALMRLENYTEEDLKRAEEEQDWESGSSEEPVENEPVVQSDPYPDLMTPDPLLDPRDVLDLPPTKNSPFHNRVIIRNHTSVFDEPSETDEGLPQEDKAEKNEFFKTMPVSKSYYYGLHQSILMRRMAIQQTGKGKKRRIAYMVLLGDGNGLIGLGEGKHENGVVAHNAARINALRNMDYVERFEKRTVWTEMETKLGATQILIRPRPVGFGLRCNPWLHQILRAAGFKDVSAKVWGSRNKMQVIKAAFRMLQGGHAPPGMGDGIGGKGKTLSRGSGMKTMGDLERARGRKLISLRK